MHYSMCLIYLYFSNGPCFIFLVLDRKHPHFLGALRFLFVLKSISPESSDSEMNLCQNLNFKMSCFLIFQYIYIFFSSTGLWEYTSSNQPNGFSVQPNRFLIQHLKLSIAQGTAWARRSSLTLIFNYIDYKPASVIVQHRSEVSCRAQATLQCSLKSQRHIGP